MTLRRAATTNVAEGLGMARWGDDEATLREVYPEAYVRPRPGVGAPLIVPCLFEDSSSPGVKGYFFLGPRGVEYIVLSENSEMDGMDVLPCVHGLAHRFGFGPVTASKRQTWVVNGSQILLQLCDPFEEGASISEFLLRVNHPGTIQPDFRIFEAQPLWPRRVAQPLPARDQAVLPASVRSDSFVECPFCGRVFSLTDSARWDGSRHLTCGQRIQLEPFSNS